MTARLAVWSTVTPSANAKKVEKKEEIDEYGDKEDEESMKRIK